jgi:hypothetical protein
MGVATILQHSYYSDAFARPRMMRVVDCNIKGLFLGSIS